MGSHDDHVDAVLGDVVQNLFVRVPLDDFGHDGQTSLSSSHLDISYCPASFVPERFEQRSGARQASIDDVQGMQGRTLFRRNLYDVFERGFRALAPVCRNQDIVVHIVLFELSRNHGSSGDLTTYCFVRRGRNSIYDR